MKILLTLLLLTYTLFGSLRDKSAILYYGKDLSYNMVGIHDYIIVQPKNTNPNTHGFHLYNDKIYAYLSIGEIEKNAHGYSHIKKEWIATQNKTWKSAVLDIRNKQYRKFIFKYQIKPLLQEGFHNFFFDTLDSYHLYTKTPQERKEAQDALAAFINEFHKRYPQAKLIVNRGFGIIDQIHNSITAVLFESYYKGLKGVKLNYTDVSNKDRKWLDTQLEKIRNYKIDIIAVDYLPFERFDQAPKLIQKLQKKGFIPYISTKELNLYGRSSKNALKREILTIIDEHKLDRTLLEAHQHGDMVLQYLGYKQHFLDISSQKLPTPKQIQNRYAGVIIWLQSILKNPIKFTKWLKTLHKHNIKIVFINNFATLTKKDALKFLGIQLIHKTLLRKKILVQDSIVGYEIPPSIENTSLQILLKDQKARPLLSYENIDGSISTNAAITSWGGYIIGNAYMINVNHDNLWVTNPFAFFQQALRLETLPVPDPTTQNGDRLFFTHVDGDGMLNKVEGEKDKISGEQLYDEILTKYHIPHSISVIGCEISPKYPLYPQYVQRAREAARKIFSLQNVEPASHTFTHTFFWGKIKNDNLDEKYRLKPKGYHFSLKNELLEPLLDIQHNLLPKNSTKKAQTIFWSGDCAPRLNALNFIYTHHLLNINGGDTTITNTQPWLSLIAPFGLQRGEYYQIYTGEQNENIYTHNWLGPYWGFKRVLETYELTNRPNRYKPIDVYYHIYSASKEASLKALKYVFDHVLEQKNIFPIYTSEYIPKVQDMYDVSIANKGSTWLITGMKDLKTLRLDGKKHFVDLAKSPTVVGITKHLSHHYISLNNTQTHYITLTDKKQDGVYITHANGYLQQYNKKNDIISYTFKGYVEQRTSLHVDQNCKITVSPKAFKIIKEGNDYTYFFHAKKAKFSIRCR